MRWEVRKGEEYMYVQMKAAVMSSFWHKINDCLLVWIVDTMLALSIVTNVYMIFMIIIQALAKINKWEGLMEEQVTTVQS